MTVPVILINRDLMTWPSKMIEDIKRFKDVGEITILDNGSTNPLVLDWYEHLTDIRIERLTANLGHRSPWISGLVNEYVDSGNDFYIVSDPDLDLKSVPDDCVERLIAGCECNDIRKCGLSLDLYRCNPRSPWYMNGRFQFDRSRLEYADLGLANTVLNPVDTTFAIWRSDLLHHSIQGGMLMDPYEAVHIPWTYSVDEMRNDPEYWYYLTHANESSTTKQYLMRSHDA